MGKVSKFSPIFVNITLYRQLLCFAFTLLFFQNIEQRIFGEYDTKIENLHLTERRYTNCTTVLVEFANTTGDSTDAKRFHIFFYFACYSFAWSVCFSIFTESEKRFLVDWCMRAYAWYECDCEYEANEHFTTVACARWSKCWWY